MRGLTQFCILALCSNRAALAFTYWLDASCTTGSNAQKVQPALDEALTMARRAVERTNDPNDATMAGAFQAIFKVPSTNLGVKQLITTRLGQPGPLGMQGQGIAGMVSNVNRQQSNLRIYCDDDPTDPNPGAQTRWTLAPDIPGAADANSRRPPDQQEWRDVSNGIRILGTPGCAENPDEENQAETFIVTTRVFPAGSQAQERATMTLCNFQLDSKITAITRDIPRWRDLARIVWPRNRDKQPKAIDSFVTATSFVILHELTHLPFFTNQQDPSTHDFEYKWDGSYSLDTGRAANNADSYAFYGLLALLADRKWRLSDNAEGGSLKWSLRALRVMRSLPITPRNPCANASPDGMLGKVCKRLKA